MPNVSLSTITVHTPLVIHDTVVPVPDTVAEEIPSQGASTEFGGVSMISVDVRFIRNQEVVVRNIQGELIIVPIRRGGGDLNSLYTLNPAGAVLWDFMNEGHTLGEMVKRVCPDFEVTAVQAQEDIEVFLDSLMQEKLIVSVG
jgi:hypothetical protein